MPKSEVEPAKAAVEKIADAIASPRAKPSRMMPPCMWTALRSLERARILWVRQERGPHPCEGEENSYSLPSVCLISSRIFGSSIVAGTVYGWLSAIARIVERRTLPLRVLGNRA